MVMQGTKVGTLHNHRVSLATECQQTSGTMGQKADQSESSLGAHVIKYIFSCFIIYKVMKYRELLMK